MGSPNQSVVISSNSTLNLSGTSAIGNIALLGSLADSATASSFTGQKVVLGTNTLETGLDNTDTQFSGVISGAGGLIKTGSGSFTLAGASTYTGPTTINNGVVASDRPRHPRHVALDLDQQHWRHPGFHRLGDRRRLATSRGPRARA